MRELALVLRFRTLGILHEFMAFRQRGFAKGVAALILFGGFALGVFLLTRSTTAYMMEQLNVGLDVYHRFLSLVMYLLFLTVNLGSVIVCIAYLFRSPDIGFLMALPVPREAIFLSKLADALLSSSSTLLLLGASFLAGYASYFQLSFWWYAATVVFAFFPMLIIAGVVGVLAFIGLLRLAIAARIRQFVPFVFVLYFAIVYLLVAATNPVQLVRAMMDSRPAFMHFFDADQPLFMAYLPSQWLTEYLFGSLTGMTAYALSYLLLMLSLLLALFGFAVLEGRALYYRTWQSVLAMRPGAMHDAKSLRLPVLGFGRGYFAHPGLVAILRRDFWLFVREPSQWVHAALLTLLSGLFLASLFALEFHVAHPTIQAVAFVMVFSFNGFMVATAALRFVFPAVGLEGFSFWSVRTSPFPLGKLYWSKLIPLSLLVLAFGEVLTSCSVVLLRNDPLLHLMAWVAMACVALTITAVHLGGGAYFASFRERNAVRIASSQGGSLTFLVALIYLLSIMILLIFPLNRHFEGAHGGSAPVAWFDLPFMIILFISVALAGLSTILGLRSIRKEQ